MSKIADEVAHAEQEVIAAKQELLTQVREARQVVASPVVIGAAVAGVTALAWFMTRRRRRKQVPRLQVETSPAVQLAPRQPAVQTLLEVGRIALPIVTALQAMRKNAAPRIELTSMAADPSLFTPLEALPEPAPSSGSPIASTSLFTENRLRQAWQLTHEAVTAWMDDFAPSMGAALAYYTIFSLAPMLIIVIAIAGIFFGQEAAQGEIVAQLRDLLGNEGAIAVEGLLKSASRPGEGIVAATLGFLTLAIGATAVFGELQSALDRIWHVPPEKRKGGLLTLLRTRLTSFGMVLGLGFMLLVSLVVSAVLAAFGKWWGGMVTGWEIVLQVVNFGLSFAIVTGLFAMIYKLMPRVKIPWRDVWVGAAVTALLFSVGKFLIGLYLGKTSMASSFGAAGSLVILLVWIYYSAQIFLLGAEFTRVFSHRYGSRVGKRLRAELVE